MLGAFGFAYEFGFNPLTFFGIHLGAWFLCDALLALKLEPEQPHLFPVIWAARELLALPMWVHTALGRTVQWRGRSLTLKAGGLLEDA